jgi:hypothetical protein
MQLECSSKPPGRRIQDKAVGANGSKKEGEEEEEETTRSTSHGESGCWMLALFTFRLFRSSVVGFFNY